MTLGRTRPRTERDIIRTVKLSPYRAGRPTWTLRVWDTHGTGSYGKARLGYEFVQHENGKSRVIFTGEDFYCSPQHAIDSDATIESLLGFLTLRPGDTDDEYFTDYTAEQMEFAEQYAERLAVESMFRFGEKSYEIRVVLVDQSGRYRYPRSWELPVWVGVPEHSLGDLFVSCQREYGRCISKIYFDQEPTAAGWVFERMETYEDTDSGTFKRHAWVEVRESR